MSTVTSSAPPATKNTMIDRIAARFEWVRATAAENSSGPKIPANFSNTAKNPKNSAVRSFGIKRGEHGSAQRLAAALYQADERGEHHEIAGGLHPEAEHADHRVEHERAEDRRLGADLRRHAPNRNAAGTPMNCVSSSAPISPP